MRKLKLTYTPKRGRLDFIWCWVNKRLVIGTTAERKIVEETNVKKKPSIVVLKVKGGAGAEFRFSIHEGVKALYENEHVLDETGEFRGEISV